MKKLIMMLTAMALGGLLLAACGSGSAGEQPTTPPTAPTQPAEQPTTPPADTTPVAGQGDMFTGTNWTLTEINGAAPVGPRPPTLEFFEPGRVSGTGGCNRITGGYTVDGDTISFGPLASTMMACAEEGVMEQERAYVQQLETVDRFSIEGDTLTLTADDGTTLVFTRA